jgi:hypothetical protein
MCCLSSAPPAVSAASPSSSPRRPAPASSAPALPEDEGFLRDLGVSDVIPREAVRDLVPDGVDALIDLVNYTAGTYDAALKPDARVAPSTGAAGDGPGRTNVMAAPTPENIQRRRATPRTRRPANVWQRPYLADA